MEKTHLISVLRTFDKKEVKELRKWLASPAHNVRQDVRDLFEYLVAGTRLSSERFLKKKRVHAAVYPERTFSDAEMRQVIHFLFKAVESFLLYNEILKDAVRSQAMLARVYRQRQLPKLFQKTMDAGRKIQEQHPYRNHDYFENEYLLQFEQYTYLSGLSRTVPLNLQEVSDVHDIAYLTNKLRLSCIMLSHQTVYTTEYETGLLDEVLRHIESHPHYFKEPAVSIYYYSYKAMTYKKDRSHFRHLKEQILLHDHQFPPEEIRVIFLLTLNYCIGRINVGETSFYRESFELYKMGMQKGIFLENGVLSRFTFRNAITAALNLQEYQWVENFIHDYSRWLEEKHRENFVKFHLARLHYEKKNYNEAMKLFAQFDYDDLLMTLSAKTMLLKIYYELDEISALESLLGSMRAYLQRKKVMGYHKSNYKNIIRYTKKLLRVAPYSKDQQEKLKAEIAEANPLTERKWLLEQVDRL
jgi:hypothetical protein